MHVEGFVESVDWAESGEVLSHVTGIPYCTSLGTVL